MVDNTKCSKCGKPKKAWFKLCFDCSEKEKLIPKCEVCGVQVPENHYLCSEHYKQREIEKRDLNKIAYVKQKKEEEFKSKFEGKFFYNSQKVKSKSELLICYFLKANQVQFQYEPIMTLKHGEIRPDFVLDDGKGNYVIFEHFGGDTKEYMVKANQKKEDYESFCKENQNFTFIYTTEDDMYNLKDKLGQKLNKTPLKRALWI